MAKLAIPTIKVPLLQIIIRYTERRNKFGNSSEIGNFYRTPAKSILQQNCRSEKKAIASVAYKQDFVWIACYGKSSYLSSRYHILHERRICPFPDLKNYDTQHLFDMKFKAENYSVSIPNLLERKTNDEQWSIPRYTHSRTVEQTQHEIGRAHV